METITLVLSLAKIALETFQDERKLSLAKRRDKIEREWQDEMSKPDSERSDLELDRLVFESRQLAKLIIEQHSGK